MEAQEPMVEHKEKAYYPIPSPEQMFGFINDNGVAYSKLLLNNTSNYKLYSTPGKKALNFGVYTADLAYSAAYEDIDNTIALYKVVKTMGSDLNIVEMMSEEILAQMQQNLQNKDSLAVIAGQSYYQAVEFLENHSEEEKLALMSLGGWVESLYITLNSIDGYLVDSPTIKRIADQKVTFGNLYTYLKKHDQSEVVKEELKAIQSIRAVFASLPESKIGKIESDKSGGKMVLGGGKSIEISKDQFNALKVAINSYRERIIK